MVQAALIYWRAALHSGGLPFPREFTTTCRRAVYAGRGDSEHSAGGPVKRSCRLCHCCYRSQCAQEGDEVGLLMCRQMLARNQVEVLDRILKRQEAPGMEVRRRFLDAAKRDVLIKGELYMFMNSGKRGEPADGRSFGSSHTHTPGYKETAVKLEVLAVKGESPLPRAHFRFGHRTPRRGVEVERKCKQPGYRFPGNDLIKIDQS
jgi:hypothetical protein